MKFSRFNYIIVAVQLCIIGYILLFLPKGEKKIPFVKLGEVYDNFSMTKELDAKYKAVVSQKKNLLDSLEFSAKMFASSSNYSKDIYQSMASDYIKRRTEFEESNEELKSMYEEQIWKQINSYIEKFGKDRGYDYILGAQGTGTVMYADPDNEITGEFIRFLNNSYEGKIR